MSAYPYADRFPCCAACRRKAVTATHHQRAPRHRHREDTTWETGKCSGTMYCGDHDHYDFMNEVFGMYSHMNVLQATCARAPPGSRRDHPMALDLMHGDAAESVDDGPVGLITSGGTGSILPLGARVPRMGPRR